MSPRILVLCSSLGVGGAQRQLVALVPRLRDRGFEPVVRTLRSRGGGHFFDDLVEAGISVDCAEMRSRWNLEGVRRGYGYWRLQPDLVFTQSVDAQVIGHFIARRLDIPHVTAHHSGPGILSGAHRTFMTRRVARRVDRVVAVSGVQLPELKELGFRPSATVLIPNGTDAVAPVVPRSQLRSDLGLSSDDFVVLLVATLRPEKQVGVFIESVARAHAREPRIRGLIAGGGPGVEEAKTLADAGGGLVQVLGQRADIPDLLAASDCLGLSSDGEALPLSLIEAMFLEKPIVATNVGGIPDAVVHGETGLLVPPRDSEAFASALLELAHDPAQALAMGRAGHARFEARFTVDRMVDGYVDLLNDVLRERAEAEASR
jgi:glycosyltransferase involved in cell wall biosynthesis